MGFPFLRPSVLCYNNPEDHPVRIQIKGGKIMTKRFFCIALSVLLLTAGSCTGAPAGEGPETSSVPADTPETEASPAETEYVPPEADYDGRTFTFITGGDIIGYISRDEVNGDVVNDAMFHTEASVEDLYNAIIESYAVGDQCTVVETDIVKQVLAGDTSFNAAYANSVYLANAQTKGIYKNLRSVEAFDFSQPWWPTFSVEAMTVDGQMYLGNSSISCSAFARSHVIFANKAMMNDYGQTVPYDTVKAGTWTLEQLIALTKTGYQDTNGNGKADPGDRYGWAGSYWSNHWALSSGYAVITKTGDEAILKIDIDIDKMSALVDKIYSWFYEESSSYIDADPVPVFMDGNALFSEGMVLDAVNRLRDSDVEYAILPYPKNNETQESYYTYTQGWLFVLPNLASDEDFDGRILEALAYYRHSELIPAYYETTVKGKIADQKEDAEMLEIIYTTMTETFDRCYDAYHGMQIVLNQLIPNRNRDFASWYASILPSARAKLEDLAKFYKDNE